MSRRTTLCVFAALLSIFGLAIIADSANAQEFEGTRSVGRIGESAFPEESRQEKALDSSGKADSPMATSLRRPRARV